MRRRFLVLVATFIAICFMQPAAYAAQTVVVNLTPRTSSTVLNITGSSAFYDARAENGSVCSSNTYISVQPTWRVRQVSRSSVNVYQLTLRVYARRSFTLGAGYLQSASPTYYFRTGATSYSAGTHYFNYTMNRNFTPDSYRYLKVRLNYDFGPYGTEPVYCNYNSFLGFWARVA